MNHKGSVGGGVEGAGRDTRRGQTLQHFPNTVHVAGHFTGVREVIGQLRAEQEEYTTSSNKNGMALGPHTAARYIINDDNRPAIHRTKLKCEAACKSGEEIHAPTRLNRFVMLTGSDPSVLVNRMGMATQPYAATEPIMAKALLTPRAGSSFTISSRYVCKCRTAHRHVENKQTRNTAHPGRKK